VIAIPHATPFVLHRVADQLRTAVHGTAAVLAGRWFAPGTLSISVGAASTLIEPGAESREPLRDVDAGEALFRAADTALYRAKASGRNQICIVDVSGDASSVPARILHDINMSD
jgi:GGDEF domain-containing protein